MRLSIVGIGALYSVEALAQTAGIAGQVMLPGSSEPVPYATVTLVGPNRTVFAGERGQFVLEALPAGQVRLRVKRIGFSPRDTTFTLRGGEQASIRIDLARLAIELPKVIVDESCSNRTPFETRSTDLSRLFEQVVQNAERLRFLAEARPFVARFETRRSEADRNNDLVLKQVDSASVGALPVHPYAPKRVVWTDQRGQVFIMLPQLPDFTDTSFTNNHCFHYAGQTRLGAESVLMVDFEPVPWLNRELDLTGTLYLRVGTYELIETFTRLNRIARPVRGLVDYSVRARFHEFEPGQSTLFSWELTNWVTATRRGYVEHGKLVSLTFADSTTVKIDTVRFR